MTGRTIPQLPLIRMVGAGLAVVMMGGFIARPMVLRIQHQRAVLAELRAQHAMAQALVDEQDRYDTALQERQAQYQTLQQRWRTVTSMAGVIETLTALAKSAHVELLAAESHRGTAPPAVIQVGPDLVVREVPLTLEVSGRYRQLGDFLGRLHGAPCVTSLRGMGLARQSSGPARVKMQLLVLVYLAEPSP